MERAHHERVCTSTKNNPLPTHGTRADLAIHTCDESAAHMHCAAHGRCVSAGMDVEQVDTRPSRVTALARVFLPPFCRHSAAILPRDCRRAGPRRKAPRCARAPPDCCPACLSARAYPYVPRVYIYAHVPYFRALLGDLGRAGRTRSFGRIGLVPVVHCQLVYRPV